LNLCIGTLLLPRIRRFSAEELHASSAKLGFSKAHYLLADVYYREGQLKKASFHFEAAPMAGHKVARFNLGSIEGNSGNRNELLLSIGHCTASGTIKRYAPFDYSLQTRFR
jgi:hypothetical protein